MIIESNKVVTFHYRVSEPVLGIIEDSHDGDPVMCLCGHDQVLKGMEEAMLGKKAGDSFTVTLPPEKAYGLRQENSIQRISMNYVLGRSKRDARYAPGSVIQVNTKDGPRTVAVVKSGLKSIDIDTNHPLAGKTLTFDMDIVDVRDATTEELAHGHAHGAGGHQH